jgi:arylsulfatase A
VEDESKYKHKATSNYRGMKGDAWEGGHRMPFVVRWPKRAAKGTTSQQLVCLTDIFATCAAIVGHQLPKNAAEDSIDFSAALVKQDFTSRRTTLVVNSTKDFMMVRQDNMKLIPFRGSGGFSKPKHITDLTENEAMGQLYDLAVDASETTNLYLQQATDVARLTKLLDQIKVGTTRPAN